MNRRQALLAAIALVGGAATVPLPAWAYEGTKGPVGRFFSGPEMALLAEVAEIMIPATDTPGARDANVHGVVDGLMVDWAEPQTQAQFRAVLAGIDGKGPRPFLALAPAERAALLTGIDIAAFSGKRPEDQGWRRLKQLIWYAYFTSQGADPDYVAVPGDYRGDLSKAEYRHLVEERR
ncbi:gluconate 2-dehydrogenase subunit 3 family protein [Niveispirillum sp. KHB5.9]